MNNASCIPGKITGIHEHSNGKHVELRIVHGRKSPAKKGESSHFAFDDRPHSSVYVPKSEAGNYRVGQRAMVNIADPDLEATGSEADDDTSGDPAMDAKSAASGLFNATRR